MAHSKPEKYDATVHRFRVGDNSFVTFKEAAEYAWPNGATSTRGPVWWNGLPVKSAKVIAKRA